MMQSSGRRNGEEEELCLLLVGPNEFSDDYATISQQQASAAGRDLDVCALPGFDCRP